MVENFGSVEERVAGYHPAGIARLEKAVAEQEHRERVDQAKDAGVIGEEAWRQAVAAVETLSRATADDLIGSTPSGVARMNLRFLVALVSDDVPDRKLAAAVAEMVDNSDLTRSVVSEVLRGKAGEPHAAVLRVAANLLRDGMPQRQVADELSIRPRTVEKLSVWLQIPEARHRKRKHEALRIARRGGNAAELATATGMSREMSQRYMRAAKALVDSGDMEAAGDEGAA